MHNQNLHVSLELKKTFLELSALKDNKVDFALYSLGFFFSHKFNIICDRIMLFVSRYIFPGAKNPNPLRICNLKVIVGLKIQYGCHYFFHWKKIQYDLLFELQCARTYVLLSKNSCLSIISLETM